MKQLVSVAPLVSDEPFAPPFGQPEREGLHHFAGGVGPLTRSHGLGKLGSRVAEGEREQLVSRRLGLPINRVRLGFSHRFLLYRRAYRARLRFAS